MNKTNPTPAPPETLEPPERIRVVVRAATGDDWIGVAYSKDYVGDPSTIHEYRRAAVAGPRGVIELLSASLLHPQSAEDYVRQAIEMLSTAATSSPAPAEPRICVKCGRSNFNRVQGECDEPGK